MVGKGLNVGVEKLAIKELNMQKIAIIFYCHTFLGHFSTSDMSFFHVFFPIELEIVRY